jgi:hypothetical protein
MNLQRIESELAQLRERGLGVDFFPDPPRPAVIYRSVPTDGESRGLPGETDVVVPVPSGYAAGMIDLAGLEVGSPFFTLVKGGNNCQGVIEVDGRSWHLASYHPHNGGGGPPWNANKHGFHTYYDYLVSWMYRL